MKKINLKGLKEKTEKAFKRLVKTWKRENTMEESIISTSVKELKADTKIKIEWFEQKQLLCEAVTDGIELALVSEDNKQSMPFVHCKDYLQDAVQGHLLKRTNSIYGFTYNPIKFPGICTTKIRLLAVNHQDKEFKNKVPNCLDFINQFEKELGIINTKTTVVECDNPPPKYKTGAFLFEGNARWIRSPVMISLYSLLIRLGFSHKIGKSYKETIEDITNGKITTYQPIDKHRLAGAKKGIEYILKHGDRDIFYKKIENNYPKKIDCSVMHNYMGIQAFSTDQTKQYITHWHRELEKTHKES